MGCRKITYHEQEALGENWKIFIGGLEKTASGVKNCKKYYSFGSVMPNEDNLNIGDHTYGFNGQMKDNETYNVTGGSLDFGERIYNSRLGKFLSVDPLTSTYSMLSPYQFASNTPIQAIDLDGLEGVNVVDHSNQTTTVVLTILHVTGDGFNNDAIKDMVDAELAKKSFKDNRFKQSDGTGYDVKFNIMLKEVATLEEAKEIQKNNQLSTTRLSYEKTDWTNANGANPGSTGPGQIIIDSKAGPHTFTHEIFHSLVSFGDNAPDDIHDDYSKGQRFAHSPKSKYGGGIFEYQKYNDLSDKNVRLAIEHTFTVELSPLEKVEPISAASAVRSLVNILKPHSFSGF